MTGPAGTGSGTGEGDAAGAGPGDAAGARAGDAPAAGAGAGGGARDGARAGDDAVLAARVLDAVLREDYGGARRHVRREPDGTAVFEVPGHRAVRLADGRSQGGGRGATGGTGLHAGFLSEEVVLPGRGRGPKLSEALAIVRTLADPRDDVASFERECREALRTRRLHDRSHEEVLARLRTACRRGAGTYYDTLAAFTDHPVHPTGFARLGMSATDLRRYAPEFAPRFRLRWAAVPRGRVTARGDRPQWWPSPGDVGLEPGLAATHDLFPVHPLTARTMTARTVTASSDTDGVVPAISPFARVEVAPTLSVRTVAVLGDGPADAAPREHLKLPLPVSTLGARNRRLIAPGTLADGALMQRILQTIAAVEYTAAPVLFADEQTYGHAGDPMFGFLLRRYPAEVADAAVVPVAALTARAPDGRHVIEEWGAESLFDAYLGALFDWNVLLFVRYGIALEAHQQNVSLVLGGSTSGSAPPRPRLLLKDNDAALVDGERLASALGPVFAPGQALGPRQVLGPGQVSRPGRTLGPDGREPIRFEDERMTTRDQDALARVFVTITLHLCAGAIAFALAERGLLALPTGLRLVRERLDEALGRFGPEGAFLRSRTLDADRLPTKAMITAGTLVDKARTGARDINKHYGPPGPNYLRNHQCF